MITELLHFASRGNVARMKMLIAHRRVNVRILPSSHSACRLSQSTVNTIRFLKGFCLRSRRGFITLHSSEHPFHLLLHHAATVLNSLLTSCR